VEPYITDDRFMLTYGDAVSDIDLRALLAFHDSHEGVGTVTGVAPPSRYGELAIEHARVVGFAEKPAESSMQISGGYFVFDRSFLGYLDAGDACVLEHEPLERLTKEGQLMVYEHAGFWQCMDTPRDYQYLQSLWRDAPPWKRWDG
jgi:glucose-1-phosphate cytidylyltransferase